MYSILLVEDEELELETLRDYIDWESLECSPVYAVHSARRALEVILEQKPDIVITDIQMPGMTGLELAEKIREMGMQQKIVFLTGYDRYDYVKKAMSVEATDYILKPFTEESIGQVITRVKEKIKKEQWMQQSISSAQKMMFERLCCHRDGYSETYGWIQQFSESQILEETLHVIAVYGSFTRERCREFLKKNKVILHYIVFDRLIVCLVRNFVSSKDMALRVQNYFQTYCVAGCSVVYLHNAVPLEKLYVVCQELQELFLPMFYSEIRIWEMREALDMAASMEKKQKDYYDREEEIRQIQQGLLCYSRERVMEELENYLKSVLYLSYSQTVFYSLELCKSIEDLYCLRKSEEWEIELKEIENSIVQSCHFEEIRLALYRLFDILTIKSGESRKDQVAEQAVNQAKKYIKDHYREAVIVEELAQKAGISTNYLRTIFKERTGATIYDYTTHVRLEMAKELLTDETQKVKDVGAMVGYENSAHFVSIFRKKFGMTPNEYRRIILEGKNMVQKRNGKNT